VVISNFEIPKYCEVKDDNECKLSNAIK